MYIVEQRCWWPSDPFGHVFGVAPCNVQGHGTMERDEEVWLIASHLCNWHHCSVRNPVVFFSHCATDVLYYGSGVAFVREDMWLER